MILPPNCVEHALPNLVMSPLTLPHDHSPVKPALSIETKETDDDSDNGIDDIEDLNSEVIMLFGDIYEDHCNSNKDCIINSFVQTGIHGNGWNICSQN